MTDVHTERIANVANLPALIVTDRDYEKLVSFIDRHATAMPRVARFLEQELERAELVPSRNIPSDVVTMNSRLLFRTTADGLSRAVTLVYPAEADLLAGRLSIMTPAGVALLGLRAGQSMPWEDRTGAIKTLTVQHVLYQPEANGRFDL